MRFPDALSPESFLSGFWQKRPLFMPAALDGVNLSLEPDELAWLATQEDVESRLVVTHREGKRTRYEVRDGPFEVDLLAALPPRDWTLLVQDVEKHLPDLRAIFAAVDFIPDWRIDDLMISYAAPGGGVGPHRDNYDVFLCQGEGQREWRLADTDACKEDASSTELSLLLPFVDERPHRANAGDVLYLPPGVPHWGIARNECMTWSIGMRAPTVAELTAGVARILDENGKATAKSSAAPARLFYEDPDLTPDEALPGLISDAAVRRATRKLRDFTAADDYRIAMILGCVVTEPKTWLAPETLSVDEASQLIDTVDQDSKLHVHGMARIAFCEAGGTAQVFANGHARQVAPFCLEWFRRLCRDRCTTPAQFVAAGEPGLLHWLLERGVIDLTECSRESL